jgi:hypothetical protein
MLPQYY